MGKVLGQEQIRFYKENGYLVAQDIFEPEDIDETLRHFNLSFVQQLDRLGLVSDKGLSIDALHQNMASLLAADVQLYLATLRMCSKLCGIYRLMTSQRLKDATADLGIDMPLFQTTPVLHLMSKKLVIPGGYQGFDVHQDWTSVQGSLDAITTWIPFMDVDANLFTMEVIPKSHLHGLLDGVQEENIYRVAEKYYDESDFEPIQMSRGGVCLMSNFTAHRSSGRGDDRLRISASGRYENASEASFIEREYPFTQLKSLRRGFITENFPSQDQVRSMYAVK